ncbi:hypothetical protein [Leptolyngbya sp. BC1307]|nr:hypothetical protein [Leptolyngbya sp. BC1307]
MVVSTLLTLVVVPVVYSFVDDATEFLKQKQRRLKKARSPRLS